jgi:hypothetical protein
MATHGRAVGAIFMFDGADLIVKPTVQAAEKFIEAYDAEDLDAYDELGHRLQAQVVGAGWPKRIELLVSGDEAELPTLTQRVRAFMQSTGTPSPPSGDEQEWLHEAAASLATRKGRRRRRRRT